MKKHIYLAALLSAALTTSAFASVVTDGTRLVFNGDKKEASITVENKDSVANLVQSWVEPADKTSLGDTLIITPPLFRMGAGDRNVLRIIRSGKAFPENSESMYWLNVKGIPAIDKKDKTNKIQLAINNRIKLIYRPEALKGKKPEDYADKIQWTRSGNELIATNPSAYYMNFYEIKMGNTKIAEPGFISPNGQAHYQIPAGAQGSAQVEWSIINDFGVKGKLHSTH